MCVLSSLRQVISLLHHPLCQTETYIYCTVDMLQPYSWREEKKQRETGWNGLRQQRFWERSDLDAESKSESAKDFPHHLWNTWEKKWAQTLWSHAEVHRLLGASISLVCWKLPIFGTLLSLEDCAFTWEFHDEPLGTKAVLNTQWNI